MFYTTEEAAVLGGFLELYLERDSVDAAVREKYEKFRLGLVQENGTGNSDRGCWVAHWNGPIMNGRLRHWDSCAPNGGRSMKIIGRWKMPC